MARLRALAFALTTLAACSNNAVPSPATATLADETVVWQIQEQPPCPDGADCGIGVYINRWYYDVNCDGEPLEVSTLGTTFAISDEDLLVDEARTITGLSPETLALHVRDGNAPCHNDRWISSIGIFDDDGLDEPPKVPHQRPPTP
jgi:hypothetical protein